MLEWQIGDRLPAIADLQKQYDVPGLNTVRAAQQKLVDEGLLRSEQGRGVFVVAIPDSEGADPVAGALAKLREARQLLAEVEAALQP